MKSAMMREPAVRTSTALGRLPRLGFIGTGWIGRMRMEALRAAGCCELSAVHDSCPEAARAGLSLCGAGKIRHSFDELLSEDLDGIVIATPGSLCAEQCIQALSAGMSVFCQKPLARTANEAERVVDAARQANRRLAVDFSYRYLVAMEELKRWVSEGELGDVFAVDLVFHSAYGPDEEWLYPIESTGGGCVMDLGAHLVDLALWLLPRADVHSVASHLFKEGTPLRAPIGDVEDYARASFNVGNTDVNLSCSWRLHAGCDAVIEATFHGTQGGASLRNVVGSFFDFELRRFTSTSQKIIPYYPDAWGGRALVAWAQALNKDPTFDPEVENVVRVAKVLDTIYGR